MKVSGSGNIIISGSNNSSININQNKTKENPMEQIRILISGGKISQALDALYPYCQHDRELANYHVLYSSQHNGNEKDNNMGVKSNDNYNMARNRITQRLLGLLKQIPFNELGHISPSQPIQDTMTDTLESQLLGVIQQNKRRRKDIAEKAQSILTKYTEYKQEKAVSPTFDIVGRRLTAIQNKANKLFNSLGKEKEKSLIEIVERIQELVNDIPPYFKLDEAYELASGRGFNDKWIEQQLKAQPDDEEVQITIAERIEVFAASIRVK